MEWVSADVLKALTPTAVVLLIPVFFMLGVIRPRSAIKELREEYAERIADLKEERNVWREVAKVSEESRLADREISKEALEIARTNEAVIVGLRTALELREREG